MDLEELKSVIRTVQDQHTTIQLLQSEIHFQKERIDKQDRVIDQLSTKIEQLAEQLSLQTNSTEKRNDESPSSIWKDTENLSIAEAVKETAEKVLMNNLGFVFDLNTKLYCNYSTGYYYDPGQELFYNGHTGVYYTYDADNQKYLFHSQVQLDQNVETVRKKTRKIIRKGGNEKSVAKQPSPTSNNSTSCSQIGQCVEKRNIHKSKSKVKKSEGLIDANLKESVIGEDMEEGELSGSSGCESSTSDASEEEILTSKDHYNSSTDDEEQEYPPCIRAIVLESISSTIRKGSLFLITCMGGTIGSEGLHHTIMLPDPSVEKHHATIVYSSTVDDNGDDKNLKNYFISDHGSSTGTFLNGIRLSESQQCSEKHAIVHGSIVKIGGFSILMHIHPGSFTCGHCEPGLLMGSAESIESQRPSYHAEIPKTRNALMKQIKKKYGIEKHISLPDADSYKDRSHERRTVKGSDNPYEKTQVVNAEESISKNNKGFKMLSKMGWNEGSSLGNMGNDGLLEPVRLEMRCDRSGLGMESSSLQNDFKKSPSTSRSRVDQLAITMKRFKEAAGATEIKMEVDANVVGDGNLSTS
ncbi:angiogenic factor with G patch and FHA domains 1 isoform X2 [Folsomia candida]|uniref:angiogenic factor with G patch and FHA domains 1 isoform X2 n=1 Tax=Folsomia candida TaxID=158441 RepID=UPI000B8FE73E|nr:angiogenic factor with G patch and FHA domains 1 isoform X2 [Folsomia candida]